MSAVAVRGDSECSVEKERPGVSLARLPAATNCWLVEGRCRAIAVHATDVLIWYTGPALLCPAFMQPSFIGFTNNYISYTAG